MSEEPLRGIDQAMIGFLGGVKISVSDPIGGG